MVIRKDAVSEMEERMNPEQVRTARLSAEREMLSFKLAKLRERQGIKQTEMKAFTQH